MVNSRDESVHANIRMNGEILEKVDTFTYLGATITKWYQWRSDPYQTSHLYIGVDKIKNYIDKYKNWL